MKFSYRYCCRRRKRGAAPSYFLLVLLLCCTSTAPPPLVAAAAAAASSASSSSASVSIWKRWLQSRCGGGKPALWAYRGSLYDPLNGQKVCDVEGVEIVRKLASIDHHHHQQDENNNEAKNQQQSRQQRKKFARRCGDLSVVETLTDPKASYDYACTLLSRKLFCYTTTTTNHDGDGKKGRRGRRRRNNNKKQANSGGGLLLGRGSKNGNVDLLRSIRLRPTSPERSIPIEQAAIVYDTATTVVVESPDDVYVHTEWPDGRAIWTQPSLIVNKDTGGSRKHPRQVLEYVAYARPQPRWRQKLPSLVRTKSPSSQGTKNKKDGGGGGAVVSPPRSSLIQFGNGGGGSSSSSPKFGARETYHYDLDDDDNECSVRYTRYGEGPLWYGPGRICTLELTGRRIKNWNDVPDVVNRVASQRVLGFFTANAALSQNDDTLASRQGVESFRGRGHAPIQVSPEYGDDGEPGSRRFFGLSRPIVPDWMHSCGSWIRRVQASTSLNAAAPSSSSPSK